MNELRNELRDDVIAAHGGLDRWNELTSVKAHLVNGGVLWAMKGQAGVINDVNVRVDLHREFTSHFPFGRPGLRSAFTADRVAIEGDAGEVVEERFNPQIPSPATPSKRRGINCTWPTSPATRCGPT